MKIVLIAVAALIVGLAIGIVFSSATMRLLRKKIRDLKSELRGEKKPHSILRSVTEFLFVTTQICALGWVSVSYGIAVYSTVVLMQPFPVTELSQQAIDTILKVVCLKVVGNIFEHNDGPVFGTSSTAEETGDEMEGEG